MNNLIWRSVTCRPGKKSVLPKGKTEPCSRRRYRQTRPEGRSPPLRGCLRSGYALPSTAPQRHSHPDCRAVLTLIVALEVEETAGRSFSSACGSEGIEGRRGAFASGPCSHASVDPTKIRGVERSRVHQGKERDPSGADLQRKKAQFRGTKLLGAPVILLARLDATKRRSGSTFRTKRRKTNG